MGTCSSRSPTPQVQPEPLPCSRGGRTRLQFFCRPQNKLPETWPLIIGVHRNRRTHVPLVGSARQPIPRLVHSYELQSGTQGALFSSTLPAEPEEFLANEQAEPCTMRVLEPPHICGGGGCVIERDPRSSISSHQPSVEPIWKLGSLHTTSSSVR